MRRLVLGHFMLLNWTGTLLLLLFNISVSVMVIELSKLCHIPGANFDTLCFSGSLSVLLIFQIY